MSALTTNAPEDVVKDKATERLKDDSDLLSTICGVPVDALEDMIVTVIDQTLSTSKVRVTGKPTRSSDAADVEHIREALVCAAVLAITMQPILGSDGKATGWTLTGMEIDSVETPGVKFEPSTPSTHHRRHHHHH